ncbi:helix-turn-helix transcriptional regulator [Sphingobacterium sp. JB170]|uniref:helix-turn-helix domain-containing protein n=1 Tax=Sphingobacterium sp. JB170 TaxID=1434842 RepID=UPI000B3579F8|nr:helix-turn-helix transcriptional regulator [Sphingobacterium sp. JB170]
MTPLGEYLAKRSVNKSMVARKTGLTKARINELTLNDSAKLRAQELYLIAKAIGADPCEVLNKLYSHLSLQSTA